jgi:hypothetical protein
MAGVRKHESSRRRIESQRERSRERDPFRTVHGMKGLAEIVQEFSLHDSVDMSPHEPEHPLGGGTDSPPVTEDVDKRYSAQHAIVTGGQVMDIAPTLTDVDRRGIHPAL